MRSTTCTRYNRAQTLRACHTAHSRSAVEKYVTVETSGETGVSGRSLRVPDEVCDRDRCIGKVTSSAGRGLRPRPVYREVFLVRSLVVYVHYKSKKIERGWYPELTAYSRPLDYTVLLLFFIPPTIPFSYINYLSGMISIMCCHI